VPDGLSGGFARGDPVVEAEGPEALASIARADTHLAIWRRAADHPIRKITPWLDALAPEHLPEGRFLASLAEVPKRLAILCDLVELADCTERMALISDVANLATRFAAQARVDWVDLKLEAMDHDSCWRFHRDHVGFRLNATYRGPGTEWVPAADGVRALRSQRRYRGPLHALPRYGAGLFKGVSLVGKQAIVHRSPPIEGRGVTRLFLCLNEPGTDD
jgi:hypothetical protein